MSKKKSLFSQLLLFTGGIVLALCVGFIATEQYLQKTVRDAALESNEKILLQIEGRMEEFYDTMKSIATSVVYSPTVMDYYRQDTRGRLFLEEEVALVFSNTVLMEPDIVGISLYDSSAKKIAGIGSELPRGGGNLVLREKMQFGDVVDIGEGESPCYSIYFPVYDLDDREYGRQIGMCVFLMRTDSFQGFLEDSQITEHAQVFLVDGKNSVLESVGGARLGADEAKSDEYSIVSSKKFGIGGWGVVSRIPRHELSEGLAASMTVSVVAFSCALLIVGAMLLYCYVKMISRIQKIDRFVRAAAHAPRLRIEDGGRDELGTVAQGLNGMLDELERMNREILASQQKMYEIELEKRQMQILAYQNQIHPHFLYNTFDCIRSMALYYEVDDIAELTMALSNTFRFAVKGEHIVTVEEEIRNIEEYAKIIHFRFMGKIQVNISAGQETLGKQVIKFILQPLVENAVFHGLEQKVEGGRVDVSAELTDSGEMIFLVEDNGCGIAPAQEARLKRMLEDDLPYKGIGISNIYQRLKLFYGESARLEIESSAGIGTKVAVRVPDHVKEG